MEKNFFYFLLSLSFFMGENLWAQGLELKVYHVGQDLIKTNEIGSFYAVDSVRHRNQDKWVRKVGKRDPVIGEAKFLRSSFSEKESLSSLDPYSLAKETSSLFFHPFKGEVEAPYDDFMRAYAKAYQSPLWPLLPSALSQVNKKLNLTDKIKPYKPFRLPLCQSSSPYLYTYAHSLSFLKTRGYFVKFSFPSASIESKFYKEIVPSGVDFFQKEGLDEFIQENGISVIFHLLAAEKEISGVPELHQADSLVDFNDKIRLFVLFQDQYEADKLKNETMLVYDADLRMAKVGVRATSI